MKIYTIPYVDVVNVLPKNIRISQDFLKEYIDGGRQDILYNPDIFCENVRSTNLVEKDFSFFNRVYNVDNETTIVISLYLELFAYQNLRGCIHYIIDHYCNMFPKNKVVFFWNHDEDFSLHNYFIEDYKNARIINYNTSKKLRNDIVVPFWTMENINEIIEEKNIFASLTCNVTHPIRNILRQTLTNRVGYFMSPKLNYDNYRLILAKSIFGLCPRGAGLSSYRFFECIHTNTIPVLFADDVVLPYEEELDYSKICIRIPEKHCSNFDIIDETLRSVNFNDMLNNIRTERHRFTLKGIQNYVHRNLA